MRFCSKKKLLETKYRYTFKVKRVQQDLEEQVKFVSLRKFVFVDNLRDTIFNAYVGRLSVPTDPKFIMVPV